MTINTLDDDSRSALVAELTRLAAQMVAESGRGEYFDAASWVALWLHRTHAALSFKRPIDFIGTEEGRRLVLKLLAQQQSAAYA
jgi:uncharacterized protein (DUF2384 family)